MVLDYETFFPLCVAQKIQGFDLEKKNTTGNVREHHGQRGVIISPILFVSRC